MNLEETLLKCNGFDFNHLPSYMNLIIEYSNNNLKKHELTTCKDLEKGIWILLGLYIYADNKSKWITIEVGSSKNILAEIRECINNMNSIQDEIKKGSYFYPDSELFTHPTYATKECCKYRTIKDTFSEFKWYQIKPYEYLKNISPSYEKGNPLLYGKKNLDIINFIESHIAFSYKPLFWNPAPQTYGNQEAMLIKIFCDNAIKELKIENNEIDFKNTNL